MPSSDRRLPLTAAQRGIWLGQQLDPASPIYNTGECLELAGPLDDAAFEAALRQAVSEAEVLHARFPPGPDGPEQALVDEDWPLHRLDFSALPEPRAAAEDWMRAALAQPADLERGPLFVQALIRLAGDRHLWYQQIHHAVIDGFGCSLIQRRVAGLYGSAVAGTPAGPGFGALQAVVEEDLAYQSGPAFARDREFWLERCADLPSPASLAAGEPPAPALGLRDAVDLDPALIAAIQAAARHAGAAWPDVLAGAFAAYLRLATGSAEVIFGLPMMGRMGSAALRVPCMAMNIIPLRVAVGADDSLAALAARVSAEVRACRPRARYRYEQLRRDLGLVGGGRRLFGPVINVLPFAEAPAFAGLESSLRNISAGPVEDLALGLRARGDGSELRLELDANPAAYSRAELAAHRERFLALLGALAEAPDEPLAAVAAALGWPAAPAGDALSSLLDGGPLPAAPRPVVELFREQAALRPAAVALEQDGRRLTYRELELAAGRVAARLRAAGAGAGTLAAVLLPREPLAVAAILGALQAGAAYLPLDAGGPSARAEAVLARARPALLLACAALAETVDSAGAELVLIDDSVFDAEAPRGYPAEPIGPPAPVAAGDLAYVIYTSGSTGQPNGVRIGHGALAQFVAGATARYGVTAADRVLQFAPLHFDASVEELFLTLCAGATLVLRTEAMLQSVPRFLDACAASEISVLDLPTAFWHELAFCVSEGQAALPADLRCVIIGGEAALPERIARWRRAADQRILLLNTYGPTEATVVATAAALGEDPGADPAPIGLPLPGVACAIIDEQGRLARPGAEGELCLLGGGLALGYLGDPALTARRFVALEQLPGAPRAYRTGDLVRRRGDGQLVYLGRRDDELKISGHRVNPAEVETALLALPGVREAAVIGLGGPGGLKQLAAHVAADATIDPAALRRGLLERLPAALVPARILVAAELPKTRSGKIDRALLRAVPAGPASAPGAPLATGLERRVLRVWAEVLGRADLGPGDDFFALGGQSLQTIQVATRLGAELGREIPVATLFRHPTAAGLAQALDGAAPRSPAGADEELLALIQRDAILPPEIIPAPATGEAPSPRGLVLLTGATGFVGAHLLRELLDSSGGRVACLVRAADEGEALERVRRALRGYGLAERGLERVEAIPADLSRPLLGLEPAQFARLAAECDAVYHNAAVVSLMRGYRSMRDANVGATRELIRLAAAERAVPLHYVSTLAVAPPLDAAPEVAEDFVPFHAGLRDGYQQSKWAAERLVAQAAARGLPASVYRLGRVAGPVSGAALNPQDLFWQLMGGAARLGLWPAIIEQETWTPVDQAARALVRLAHSGAGGVFNLSPAAPVRYADLLAWAREYGYELEPCPAAAWRAALERQPGGSQLGPGALFDMQAEFEAPRIGPIRAERAAAALGEAPVDRALFRRYLDRAVADGLLPAPGLVMAGG